jgi:hypothetical protein
MIDFTKADNRNKLPMLENNDKKLGYAQCVGQDQMHSTQLEFYYLLYVDLNHPIADDRLH